ncbi:response regulator transcription factor [Paenibacillus wynnii]|uniref:AraC family transcriptional regulator n=1 Tax=Paenibacillus wynnii TaxID=268407 RepID=A0A098M9S1_9BACL|nr:response regulator [Paenibacillus wynnii]KGE18796.1 hypothetical protein PWYN_04995 [Paenibacillus wynnii]
MRNLMVVEDETLIRMGLKVMFDWESLGIHWAAEAGNGKEALEMMEREAIDIVFTDIRMPVMDGLELMKACKDKYPDVKFVILSSYTDYEYTREAVRLGAFDYIVKTSINKQELETLLTRLLQSLPERQQSQLAPVSRLELKSYCLENMLMHEGVKPSSVDKQIFQIPFWNGNTHVFIASLKGKELDDNGWIRSLHVIISEHIRQMGRSDTALYKNGAVLLFMCSLTYSDEEIRRVQEELEWKITRFLDTQPDIIKLGGKYEWSKIRRQINEHLVHFGNDGIPASTTLIKAQEYIRQNYHLSIGLEQAAEAAKVTPNYLSRLFKQETGQSFIRYIGNLKLEKAKQLLLEGTAVSKVGEEIGYPNPRYFSKWFKILTGMTPIEFKTSNKQDR